MKTRLWIFPALVLFIVLAASCGSGQSGGTASDASGTTKAAGPNWQDQWTKVVAAAKQEGTLRIYGELSPETRQAIADPFKKQYGIEVEFVAGKGAEIAERIMREGSAGINQADVVIVGGTSMLTVLKPKGALQKLDPMLIVPQSKDASLFIGNKFPFLDNDHTAIALVAGVSGNIVINTDLIKQNEITSYQDLLKPQYKGKMVLFDPTIGGAGVFWVNSMMVKVYQNDKEGALKYLRQFAAQEPVILKDVRLQMEWVAKAKYPIAVAASFQPITDFVKVGAPVTRIHTTEGVDVGPAAGVLGIPIKPDHPNAAAVFVNWVMGDEGQRSFAESFGSAPVRAGIKTSVADPSSAPYPGDKLLWQDETYMLSTGNAREVAKEIFGPLIK